MMWYRLVDVFASQRSAILELRVVIHRAEDPVSRRRLTRLSRECVFDIGNAPQIHVCRYCILGEQRMAMGIDEAWRHGLSSAVDDFGFRAFEI